MACTGCGYEVSVEFAFCPKCGQRIAGLRPAPQVEPVPLPVPPVASPARSVDAATDRRPVTVLFADLSGFTALSERLDPEEVRALQTDLFEQLGSTVRELDGFVEKFVGDAVMAVFGAPVAHDEDPERAVRAAMQMHERVAALSTKWISRVGRPLALHIGINTGPVVAGHLGSERGAAYAVTGDTVNVASRLQNAAGPGQIFVSQSTYLLTQHAFGFEPQGALALNGKAQPMPAYRVAHVLAAPRSTRGLQSHGLAAPLVGREHELAVLSDAFESMRAGTTQLVRVVAEAGTGKSRLLAEFLARLRAAGRLADIAVRNAACSPVDSRPYGVAAALLRDAYGVAPDDSPADARSKIAAALASMGADGEEVERVPEFLGYVLGHDTRDSRMRQLDPEQLKTQMLLAVESIIGKRLRISPVIWIIEDLHWADAASVELLRFLLDRQQDRQFMMLVTHRPAGELLDLGAGQSALTVLPLEPLSADHSRTMLDALFGTSTRHLPAELQARIVEHAGGNPLFLEEMVRTLVADGVLVREDDQWSYRPVATQTQVPLTIHGLLLARIDRLPAAVRQTFQEAAVVGPVFSDSLLIEVATDPASVNQSLSALVDSGLLSPLPQQQESGEQAVAMARRYRFRHGLFQEVSYANLLARRRAELHTRIGEALERQCGAKPKRLEDLEVLGHHFRLSNDKLRGANYLVAAGDWAGSVYANFDAIRHFDLALETLEACTGCQAERLAVRERLGDVLAPAGRLAAATGHFEAAREGYADSDDRLAQARLLRKLAALHWEGGERATAKRCLESGLALIDDGPHTIERATLYREMGQLEFRSGQNDSALDWTRRALQLIDRLPADRSTNSEVEARELAMTSSLALNTLGVTLARMDRLDEAVANLEQSVQVARAAGLPQAECRALSNLGVLYSSREPKLAIEACESGLRTAKQVGDLGLQSRLYSNLAVAYCTLTNRCDVQGVGAANTAIEIDRRAGQLDHLAVSLVVLGQIFQCHGESAQALGYYKEAMELAEKSGEPQLLFPCYDGMATLYLDLDDYPQAERFMHKARETCQRAGLDPEALLVLPFLA